MKCLLIPGILHVLHSTITKKVYTGMLFCPHLMDEEIEVQS